MTAVVTIEPMIPELAARPRLPDAEGETALPFLAEIQHAKRAPVAPAAPVKLKRPRLQDPVAPVPEIPIVKLIDVKREIADVARAVAFSPAGKVTAQNLEAAIQESAEAATRQVARTAAAPELPPLTPLEQAVHELIDRIRETDEPAEPRAEAPAEPAPAEAAVASAPAPALAPVEHRREAAPAAPAAPARELDAEQAQPLNPSHVHLVLDEAERIVVTVAVRGDNVFAHVRGGDDATQAALARNAATLDSAMRARGLQLADFQASRDGNSDTGRDERERKRREYEPEQPKFIFEEKP